MPIICVLAACLALAACGSDTPPQTISKGQQLIDIQRARDSGVIDTDDYKEQREHILDQ